jgi:CDP-glucose 4,6-dehydratase
MGTVNLLETVRELGLPCAIVVVTSDKCYENREQVWGYRECDPPGGRDPYSSSKGAAEIVVGAYRRSFFDPDRVSEHGVRLASARAGNVIGGGDWSKDRIVTDMVAALCGGRPIPIRNPNAFRPWQHVLEVLLGYLLLGQNLTVSDDPKWCGAWNFGPLPGGEASVRELVETFCQIWGDGQWEDRSDPVAPAEAHMLRLCIDKAFSELGWMPRWDVHQAVARTAAWYRQWAKDPSQNMFAACTADINAYASLP